MPSEARLMFVAVGSNSARPFGMDARDRVRRLAANAGLRLRRHAEPGRAAILANMRYAWDPAWLKAMRQPPGTVLTFADEAGDDPCASGR